MDRHKLSADSKFLLLQLSALFCPSCVHLDHSDRHCVHLGLCLLSQRFQFPAKIGPQILANRATNWTQTCAFPYVILILGLSTTSVKC